jgi:predicted RNA-binding Zn-ribbon protein involved in translation (DUF1610 family)
MISKRTQYGTLAALVLIGAGYYMFRSTQKDTTDRAPDTAESITHWVCDQCGTHVELTARARERWESDAIHVDRSPGAARALRFKCDKCGKFTLCRAKLCTEHNLWFVLVDSSDQTRTCPKCAEKAGG